MSLNAAVVPSNVPEVPPLCANRTSFGRPGSMRNGGVWVIVSSSQRVDPADSSSPRHSLRRKVAAASGVLVSRGPCM
jgi:hypothetical protein